MTVLSKTKMRKSYSENPLNSSELNVSVESLNLNARDFSSTLSNSGIRRSYSNTDIIKLNASSNFLLKKNASQDSVQDYETDNSVKRKIIGLKERSATMGLLVVQDLSSTKESISNLDSLNQSRNNLKRSISLQSLQEEASPRSAWTLKFNHNGNYLAAGRQDGVLLVWEAILERSYQSNSSLRHEENLNFGKSNHIEPLFKKEPIRLYRGHRFAIADICWSSSDMLLSASLDGTVRMWHLAYENCIGIFKHSDFVTCVRFHPLNDNYFSSGTFDGRIRVWDIRQKKILYWNEIHKASITTLCFTKDGSTIIIGTLSGTCLFYEFSGLKYNTQITVMSNKSGKAKDLKITSIETMPHVSFSEEKILVASADCKVRLISLKDKSLFKTFKGVESKNARFCASFSSNGEYIISISGDRHVLIWETVSSDINQPYSGMLSALHRHLDSKLLEILKFQISDFAISSISCVPTGKTQASSLGPTNYLNLVVANQSGNIVIFNLSLR